MRRLYGQAKIFDLDKLKAEQMYTFAINHKAYKCMLLDRDYQDATLD